MIIDMRLRPPIAGWKDSRMFAAASFDYLALEGFPRPPSAIGKSVPLLVQEMDDAGIETGVVMGRQSPPPYGHVRNEELADLVAAWPSRFIAWAGIDVECPIEDSLAQLQDVHRSGLYRGVSIEPTLSAKYAHAGDEKLYPLYRQCAAMRLPVNVTLSAPLQFGTRELLEKMHPQYLVRLAKDIPTLSLHIGHAAWPWCREMIAVAVSCPNVWVSPDMYLISRFPGSEDFAKAALHLLPRRVLFGSAYPFKPLAQTVQAYREWGFPAPVMAAIFHENAKRLMAL